MTLKSVAGCALAFALLGLGAAPAAPKAGSLADAPAPSAGPTYAIKLVRPVHVGDRYNYVADATLLQTMSAIVSGRERTLRPSNLSIHFEAVEHVLEVNANGEPSKVTYTVINCTRRDASAQKQFVELDRVLTVTAGRWKSRIEIDDGQLSIADEILLRGVASVPNQKGVTMDDCFGSATPRAAGDTWPANGEAIAQFVSRQSVKVRKQDVSGTVKLKAARGADGTPHLLVTGSAKIEHWTPDATIIPKGTKFVSGTDEMKFTRLLPPDPSGPCLVESFSEKTLMKVTTDDATIGPDVLVDAKLLRTVGIKRTPVTADPVAAGE